MNAPHDINLFAMGQIVATPGALDALAETDENASALLLRHARGDWGELDDEDKAMNQRALADGSRLMSVYKLSDGNKIWVITEADRSVTTLLLPEEY